MKIAAVVFSCVAFYSGCVLETAGLQPVGTSSSVGGGGSSSTLMPTVTTSDMMPTSSTTTSSIGGMGGMGGAGGSGGDPTTLPTDISECILWLRADMGVSVEVDQVTAWANQCATGDAEQTNSARRPTLEATSGPNGTPGLNFSSAEGDNMSLAISNASNSYTLIAVIDQRLPDGTSQTLLASNLDPGTNHTFTLQHGQTQMGVIDNSTTQVDCTAPVAGPQWLEWELTGTTANCRRNGAPTGSGMWDGLWSWSATPRLGALTFAGTFAIDAVVAEVIMFSRTLTMQERTGLEDYLSGRYNL